ncbi:Golgin IMH1 [Candida viswanathii]|uniref:Golgin IMH1 n=1 Tax=Candida viswanathii TaxID=5486 RepID=A0A367Y0G2_9ASCO|nr:Golgin IMH1 [Candida viswanathii]
MFSKLKNFSEDVLNNLSEQAQQQQQQQHSKQNEAYTQLERSAKVLATETPDASQLTQPKDEDISEVASSAEPEWRVATPVPTPAPAQTPASKETTPAPSTGTASTGEPTSNSEVSKSIGSDIDNLPPPIRSKLKKFAKYEEKYPVLLDAYKVEKKKNEIIKVFEKLLQENTPISSISEGRSLVEYLDGLNEKTKMLNAEIRKLTKDNNSMNFKIVKLEESNTDMGNDLKELQQVKGDNEMLQKKVDGMSDELEKINNANDKLNKDLDEKGNKLDSLNKELEEKTAEVEKLKSDISEKDKEIAELNEEPQMEVEKSEAAEDTKPKEEDTVEDKSVEVSKDKEIAAIDESAITDLKTQLSDKEAEVKELNGKISSLKEELQDKKEEIEDLRDLVKDIGNELVTYKTEIKELKEKEQKEGSPSVTPTTSNSAGGVESLTTQVKNWETKFNAKSKENKDLQEQLKVATTKSEENDVASKRSEDQLRKQIQDLNKQLKTTEEKLEYKTKELDNLIEENEKLDKRISELSKFKTNDSALKLEIASLKTSITHKDTNISDLKSKIDELQSTGKALNSKIDQLTKSNNELQANSMSLLKDKNELLTKQEVLMDNSKSLNAQLTKLQQDKQQVVNDLEKTKNKLDSVLADKSSSANDILTYKKQHEEIMMKSKEYSLRIESLEDDLTEARNMLQERTRETSNMRRLLIDAEEMLKQQKQDSKVELSSILEDKNELERSNLSIVKRKQREIDELKEQIQDYKLKIENLESKLSLAQVNQKTANDTDTDNQNEMAKEMSSTIDTLRTALNNSTTKVKELETYNNNLKKLNEDNTMRFERLSKNFKMLNQQYMHMKDRKNPVSTPTHEEPKKEVPPEKVEEQAMNIAYLKNVLLGFFQHKEQREQLLPVLKTIFQFSEEDEEKFLMALK